MIKDIIGTEGAVQGIFMVKQATRAVSNNGSPYLSLILQDSSGTLESKMWQISEEDVLVASPGHLVQVYGNISVYRGHPQLKINELYYVDESSVDISKYIPTARTPLADMKKLLDEYIARIKDAELRLLTGEIIKDNYDRYTTYPAAQTVHHAYMGGLLYHSLSICTMAIDVCRNYPRLQEDYLIAGSLLHDIGKTVELTGAKACSYTLEGNLIGHIVLGAMMVEDYGKKLKIDPEKVTVLTHMILSHHGEYEYGSPKLPMTAESYVLHTLDDLDAKMECLKNAYDDVDEGSFTAKIPWMDGNMFYKVPDLDGTDGEN